MAHGERAALQSNRCGFDYWSRRNSGSFLNSPSRRAHAQPLTVKKVTRRRERHVVKNLLKTPERFEQKGDECL